MTKQEKLKEPSAIRESSTLTALAGAHGVSRSVLNRAIETGELPAHLFPVDARGRRTVADRVAADAALAALVRNPPKLGRPKDRPTAPARIDTLEVEWRQRAIMATHAVSMGLEGLRKHRATTSHLCLSCSRAAHRPA